MERERQIQEFVAWQNKQAVSAAEDDSVMIVLAAAGLKRSLWGLLSFTETKKDFY